VQYLEPGKVRKRELKKKLVAEGRDSQKSKRGEGSKKHNRQAAENQDFSV